MEDNKYYFRVFNSNDSVIFSAVCLVNDIAHFMELFAGRDDVRVNCSVLTSDERSFK